MNSKANSSRSSVFGFTLIELMIVVAIIGILAAIAIPKFASLIRKSSEGASKGNVGAIRSAISIYYGDMEGQYPYILSAMTVGGKYLAAVPNAKTPPYHADRNSETYGTNPDESSGWLYDHTNSDANQGLIMVNCTHTDTKGTVWTNY